MKLAIIGSRNLTVENLKNYISHECDEIVSGGAKGIDRCAEKFSVDNKLKLTVFLPEYTRYGKAATLICNRKIVDYSDEVLAFWNGVSKGTEYVINYCKKTGKQCKIVYITP